MGGFKGTAQAVGLILLTACTSNTSKWNDVGVTDPLKIRMMDEWERRGLGSDEGLHEWAISFSPNRRYGVIYRYYRNRFDRLPAFENSTYTYFRIDGDRPVFLRHDVWREMCYDALGDDGNALILQFNEAALRWIVTDPAGGKHSGMLLSGDGGLPKAEEGSFLLSTGFADYRIRIAPGGPSITRERFHEDPKFTDNGSLDFYARLPEGLPKEDEQKLRGHLAELRTAKLPEGRSARYIRAYVDAALAVEKWPSESAPPLPTVRRVLQEIAEKR